MRNLSTVSRFFVITLAICVSPLLSAGESLTGHWDGTATVYNEAVAINFDLVTAADGTISGTLSQPGEGIKHLPLLSVTLADSTVSIVAREDQPFSGRLSEDGQTIEGIMAITGFQIPITLLRSGEPQIEQVTPSPAVAEEFTGAWKGSLAATQLALHIRNADGVASAEIINLNQGNMKIPAANIRVAGAVITMDLAAINGAFTGKVNADATAIEGSYTQGSAQLPLTFTK